jgi:hypothetical protein
LDFWIGEFREFPEFFLHRNETLPEIFTPRILGMKTATPGIPSIAMIFLKIQYSSNPIFFA